MFDPLPFLCAWKSQTTYLVVFSVNYVLLPVQEPVGDFVLARIGHDGDDFFDLFFRALAGALVQVDVGFFEDYVGVPPAYALDGCKGKHDFAFAIDVRT